MPTEWNGKSDGTIFQADHGIAIVSIVHTVLLQCSASKGVSLYYRLETFSAVWDVSLSVSTNHVELLVQHVMRQHYFSSSQRL